MKKIFYNQNAECAVIVNKDKDKVLLFIYHLNIEETFYLEISKKEFEINWINSEIDSFIF